MQVSRSHKRTRNEESLVRFDNTKASQSILNSATSERAKSWRTRLQQHPCPFSPRGEGARRADEGQHSADQSLVTSATDARGINLCDLCV